MIPLSIIEQKQKKFFQWVFITTTREFLDIMQLKMIQNFQNQTYF